MDICLDWTREENYEVYLLHTICKALQQTLDTERILHIVLTGITAGGALGFSRAFILFHDRDRGLLYGKQGVGPENAEEASRIWNEMQKADMSLESLLENDAPGGAAEGAFPRTVRNVVINLDEEPPESPLRQIITDRCIRHFPDALAVPAMPEELRPVLAPSELVMLPVLGNSGPQGIIIADNAFRHNPVRREIVCFLSLISTQAGLAIENSLKYQSVRTKLMELEQVQESMHKMQEDLLRSERLATIGKMATYLAHEIRNPLVSIGGFAAGLAKETTPEIVHRDAGIIVQEVKRLELFLNNLLSFSLLPLPKREKVLLAPVIREVASVFDFEFKRKNIELEVSVPDNLRVKGDRVQLTEVFFNLLSNALNYTEAGRIGISAEVDYPYVHIRVSDTGRGIPVEELAHITEPFFTGSKRPAGLGLSIVKTVVENHQGRIEVESTPDKGATVHVFLPLQGGDK